jgi:hypothetical protein
MLEHWKSDLSDRHKSISPRALEPIFRMTAGVDLALALVEQDLCRIR